MTSSEALKELKAVDEEARRQYNNYVTFAISVGQQTERAAKKNMWIITAALIGGFCLLGLIICLIGGKKILWGILLMGFGILIGVLYNKSASEEIRKIISDKLNLENIINQNSNY